MRYFAHVVRANRLICIIAMLGTLVWPPAARAAPPLQHAYGQREFTRIDGNGTISLIDEAPSAPAGYGSFDRFGLFLAPVQPLAFSTYAIRVDYTANTPTGSVVQLDLRASSDGKRWTPWEVDVRPGAIAEFAASARFAQYRAVLLGTTASPTVQGVVLSPEHRPALLSAFDQPVAPTFRIRATRQGMVGGRTANGHIIKKRDRYVSLPSYSVLSSKGGNEYQVRITYKGHSAIAPVYDVGPWNRRDNYWDPQDKRYFADLRQGWPQDHAAYYDGHNDGRSGLGWRVRYPTAIDIGDGIWWDDLGIKGDQAEVEVTFLWMGADPLAEPPPPAAEPAAAPAAPAPEEQPAAPAEPAPPEAQQPAPEPTAAPEAPTPPEPTAAPVPTEAPTPPEATPIPTEAPKPPEATPTPTEVPKPTEAPKTPEATPVPTEAPKPTPAEVVVDNHDKAFTAQAKIKWYDSPKGCGTGKHALWTYSAQTAAQAENSARWQPSLAAGSYDVYVAIPACAGKKPNTQSARYIVRSSDGAKEIVVDQAANAGSWVLLGRYSFKEGDGGAIELHDITGEQMRVIWFDAAKWVPVQ